MAVKSSHSIRSDVLSRHEQYEALPRPSSQPTPTSSRRGSKHKHPSNQAPANTEVISSMIASLDGIEESPTSHASHALSGNGASSRSSVHSPSLSRASSRRAPSIPTPPLGRSLSHSMGHDACMTGLGDDGDDYQYQDQDPNHDDDDDDTAAAFPIIRTSRRPSGRSSHAPSPLLSPARSPTSSFKDYFRSPSRTSKSSLSAAGSDSGRPRNRRSNLSSEALSKPFSSASRLSFESQSEVLDRKPSRETLRPATIREERIAALVIDPTLTTPIQQSHLIFTSPETPTLVRTSPTGTEQLDKAEKEADILLSPGSRETLGREGNRQEHAIENVGEYSAEDYKQGKAGVARQSSVSKLSTDSSSPRKNPIADAIPLRVSSLNRTPPPGQKKAKPSRSDKGKRTAAPEPRSPWQRSSKQPGDTEQSMLEELDQEDTTVKRIKELQRKREDRLKNESAAAKVNSITSNDSTPELPNPIQMSTDANSQPPGARSSSRPDLDKQPPTTANQTHARTSDWRKAHKVLGLDGTSKSPGSSKSPTGQNYHQHQSNHSASLDFGSPRSVDTSNGGVPSSYFSGAFDRDSTLRQPIDHRRNQHDATISRKTSTKSRLLNGLDLESPDPTRPSTSHSSLSRRSRRNSNNLELWTHPDLTSLSRANTRGRRKSMSDAYHERIREEEALAERRNSVHAAVEEYLAAPRLNQKIRTAVDGRLISFSEVGDPRGAAVIVCVGMGLTRFVTAFYDELAATLGLRLITLDRPGVGESEPYPERERIGPLSWPDDVATVTQHLGISQFSILAHSAGAIYALATALILPHCIRGKVHLLAPWIPPSQFDTYGMKDKSPDATPIGALPRSQRLLRVLPIPFFKAANGGLFSPSSLKPSSVRTSPVSSPSSGRGGARKPKKRNDAGRRESTLLLEQVVPEKPVSNMFPLAELAEEVVSGLQPVRQPSINLSATATPTDPEWTYVAEALNAAEHSERARRSEYSSLLTERTWNVATRNSNPAVDLLVCLERHRDIGFRYVDIQRPITIIHGNEDKRVPAENVKWIGEQINRRAATKWSPDAKQEFRERGGCEVRILPGEGHGLMASPIVMADVLAEIEREWSGSKW